MGGAFGFVNVLVTGQPVDDVAARFAPFMVPSARPQLHYVLDRGPDTQEKTLTVRAANYAWPISGGTRREIQLQWVAGDPIARGPTLNTATAWAGTGSVLGRIYNLVPSRAYPAGAGLPSAGTIVGHGDVAVQPYLRIFGPITDPRVTFDTTGTGGPLRGRDALPDRRGPFRGDRHAFAHGPPGR